jgi:hypothetical protein
VAIQSDDEARRVAEAILAHVASGGTDVPEEVAGYSERRDLIWIGRHLSRILDDALRRWQEGDESPENARLVAYRENVKDGIDEQRAEDTIASMERAAERRAATVVAIGPAPDIAERMTGVGLHGVPLPDDATPDGEFLSTRVATPEGLMAYYIESLRATGWTLDLDHSRPLSTPGQFALPPTCFFSRPDLPGQYVEVLTGPSVDDPGRTRLLIREHDD